ncbi:MAG: GNAT family N-acetyltransferase [Chloroflexota bacterium]
MTISDVVVIRLVAPGDRANWEPLWQGYNAFYRRSVEPRITDTTWSRFFDGYEPVHALVAERAGDLVGIAHYLFHRSTTMIGPTCYLQDLFTAEFARGQGVGRALIEGVYERARAAGAERVYWQTHETNVVAMKLYVLVAERSGFVVYRKQL